MSDRPILFSAPMVRALLDGRKTQTRRLAWGKPFGVDGVDDLAAQDMMRDGFKVSGMDDTEHRICWPPTIWQKIKPGDRLWVRENFAHVGGSDPGILLYEATWREDATRAGCDQPLPDVPPKWTPCIHMPRKLSRVMLEVTGVRVQRLHDLSEQDAIAEGAVEDWADGLSVWYFPGGWTLKVKQHGKTAREGYRWLWQALHGNWDHNPEVVALTFTVTKANIDSLARAA